MSRLEFGERHERNVAEALQRRGWRVHKFGQAMLTDDARSALLTSHRPIYWRWAPDWLVESDGEVRLVDAKSGLGEFDNHAVEMAALAAHTAMAGLGIPIWYVWDDLKCATPDNLLVLHHRCYYEGASRGSGTPFVVVRRERLIHVDQAFGSPGVIAA